jgi:hypothetical protein
VVAPASVVGLHQPISISHPYEDRYLVTYRMNNGRKEILSRKFLKRLTLPSKTTVGLDPALRKKLSGYFAEVSASPKIFDEMQKADPKDMNYLTQSTIHSLGLATGADTLSSVSGSANCLNQSSATNCVALR